MDKERSVLPITISEVKAIEFPGSIPFPTREQLELLVEYPLLEACLKFYDKNILTLMSSADLKDIDGFACITFEKEIFSNNNQEIWKNIPEDWKKEWIYDGNPHCGLFFPVNKETTVKEVQDFFNSIADKFEEQKPVEKSFIVDDDYILDQLKQHERRESSDFK